MTTFNIEDVEPEGYEIVAYGKPTKGDMFLSNSGEATVASFNFETSKKLILRKKWTPKAGEVVAVRDSEDMHWDFDAFEILRDDADHPIGCARDYWAECRKLTPEERGE